MAGDKINNIFSHYSIINSCGDTCYHDSLDGYLLADGEVLQLNYSDGEQKEVQIKLHSTAQREIVEYGGIWHGFTRKEHTKVGLFYNDDGTPEFLGFLDNVTIKRINKPLGKKIDEL